MRTYLFLIGGTGSRVLRSLTMLLASGVSIGKGNSIVPIIIDYDSTNKDLCRAKELLARYCYLHQKGVYSDTDEKLGDAGFFRAEIENSINSEIAFDATQNSLSQIICFDSLSHVSPETALLLESLYDTSVDTTNSELNLKLSVGFQGNPNVGSIVFNDYFNQQQFEQVKKKFGGPDRIFVVGSIFGGTGSSGLPQLITEIRNCNKTELKNAKAGACIVMPYYKIESDSSSPINSDTYNSKTKAALSYYEGAINSAFNDVYYAGCDTVYEPYPNNYGGEKQTNPAHIVEMISAMSIIDFINKKDDAFTPETCFHNFTSQNKNKLEKNKDSNAQDTLARPGTEFYNKYLRKLNSFAFFCKFFEENTLLQPQKKGKIFDRRDNYYKTLADALEYEEFRTSLKEYVRLFKEWSTELECNPAVGIKFFDFTKEIESIIYSNSEELKNSVKGINNLMLMSIDEYLSGKNVPKREIDIQLKYFLRSVCIAGNKAVSKLNREE